MAMSELAATARFGCYHALRRTSLAIPLAVVANAGAALRLVQDNKLICTIWDKVFYPVASLLFLKLGIDYLFIYLFCLFWFTAREHPVCGYVRITSRYYFLLSSTFRVLKTDFCV